MNSKLDILQLCYRINNPSQRVAFANRCCFRGQFFHSRHSGNYPCHLYFEMKSLIPVARRSSLSLSLAYFLENLSIHNTVSLPQPQLPILFSEKRQRANPFRPEPE
ncbi:hypothetical protein NPIL_608241 [Nephila pilipes]|uniref:Uncharacterized protein n=1 Tax=Nephila pilipes TaxID=299642 RepID=A0A8X6PIZ5_NEPPI|nr:hypothetical protein NPIL_608241 [Nephila pilipes]